MTQRSSDEYPENRTAPAAGESAAPRLAYAWHGGSLPELLWDSSTFLPSILGALERARSNIDMEIYLCESGGLFSRFLEVLEAAVRRGVQVRLLLDAVGSAGLAESDRERLRDAGVELRFFNPLRFGHHIQALVRDHRKLIIIDRERVFTGGMCIMDAYDPAYSGDATWLDAMVSVQGPVADDALELFRQAWALAEQGTIREAMRWRLRGKITEAPPLSPTDAPGPCVRLCAARGGRHNPLLVTLIRRVRLARDEIWICTPYFFPPRALVRVLCHAARRGVKVSLTLPGPITDHPVMRTAGRHFYDRLLHAGVAIEEFQPRFIHLKAARVDGWTTLGSSNYDRWNLRWNLDANLEILDPAFCKALDLERRKLSLECRQITAAAWRRRSHWQRWREGFWHWLGTRILRWLHSRRA